MHKCCQDTQLKDALANDTQHNGLSCRTQHHADLNVAFYGYAECNYAENRSTI
jgi:hypothetical protein